MAFCKYSSQSVINSCTDIDNLFINEHMPYANGECVKVYLYGLYKCSNADSYDNTLESFAKVLKLSENDIVDAFYYWQEQGLVQVLSTNPIEVRYLPVQNMINNIRKFNKNKYSNFNIQIQELIEGRMITPNEYAEYYTLIESFHIEPEALIMVIKYCTDLKGKNVGHSYITTVAKNWAYEGITTSKLVEEKLDQHERSLGDLKEILTKLGIRRMASFDEKQMYLKWTKELEFSKDVILLAAKLLKKKGGMQKLNSRLLKYYELKLFSEKEITDYEDNKDYLFTTAKNITKSLGLYYENLEVIIETYINEWIKKGYDEATLKIISSYCFKKGIRNLEGMNTIVSKFYKLGLITMDSINQYMGQIVSADKEIKEVLDVLGLVRNVNSWDRDFYRTWSYSWKLGKDVILYGAGLAKGKTSPLPYLNKILSTWNEKQVKTVEEAKKLNNNSNTTANKTPDMQTHSYSKEDLTALFDNLDEVEI